MNARVGRDGRVRPLDGSGGRRRAAEVLAERPDASLREIARCAGVSVGTAQDVRRRVRDGRDPLPTRRVLPRQREALDVPVPPGVADSDGHRDGRVAGRTRLLESIVTNLGRDPSLRCSDSGRAVIRWLETHALSIDDWTTVTDAVPPHCTNPIAELASQCAREWAEIAALLAARAATCPQSPPLEDLLGPWPAAREPGPRPASGAP